jgi:hypothetical protein
MKQIGARQEAGRIGGLGACGRQLCCASWISSFNSVTTNAARTQDLSLNPQKLAGQCSKLKCCLTYELDDYLDARKEFPRVNGPLQALDADYFHVKNDILARTMSFSTQPGSMAGLVTLSIGRVREIMRLNAEGKKPEKITSDPVVDVAGDEPTYINVIGEDSITRFDKAKRNKKRKNKNNKGGQPQGEGRKEQQGEPKGEQPKADKPQGENKPKADKPRHDKPKGENKPQQGENKPKAENKPQGEKAGGEGGDKPRTEGGERPRNNRNNRNRSRNHNRGPREGGAQQSNGQQGGGQQPKGGNGQQE